MAEAVMTWHDVVRQPGYVLPHRILCIDAMTRARHGSGSLSGLLSDPLHVDSPSSVFLYRPSTTVMQGKFATREDIFRAHQ